MSAAMFHVRAKKDGPTVQVPETHRDLTGKSDAALGWRKQVADEFGGKLRFRSVPGTAAGARPGRDLDQVYSPEGLAAAIESENAGTFRDLVEQLRSPSGVIPFVGAGLSIPFGFHGWRDFLANGAELHSDPFDVLSALDQEKDFLKAATILYEESPDRFQRLVAQEFARDIDPAGLKSRAVEILPLIASGPVITTNFDHVLEAAFRAAGRPFERVITGPQPDNIIRAMHRNEAVLMKIHGDADDRSARVFTSLEYDQQYKKKRKPNGVASIPSLAWIMFTNRPLLFVGASLERDRTLEVLERIKQAVPALTHYAILAGSYRVSRMRERRQELDQYGISPLWFAPGDFGRIRGFLEDLVQESSTRLLFPAAPGASTDPVTSKPMPPLRPPAKSPDVARRLARRIRSARMAFLLGAGAHLGSRPMVREFYDEIAAEFNAGKTGFERAEVAQYVVDRQGRTELWEAAKAQIDVDTPPSVVYRWLASLPALLRRAGAPHWLWVLTTNYDTSLERVFSDRGEPFHLLYFQADGPDGGLFLHRAPDGSIRVVEQPQHVRRLEDAHVLVRLDGGVPWDARLRESVVIAPSDFAESAGRLLKALPAAAIDVLRERSLLCLGSSLRDPHVERLVRWCASQDRVSKTWTVQNSGLRRRYWSAANVSVITQDLADFIAGLDAAVRKKG
ncbi:MAG: SIR2 family protein [Bryobacteraceae bacterium]